MALESSIQKKIIDYINSLPESRAENVSGNAQQSGRADINACIKGRTFKIEVKTEDTSYGRKGATEKQRIYLEKWAKAGAVSCVVYNVEDVKWSIERFTKYVVMGRTNNYELHMSNGGLTACKYNQEKFALSGRGKWYDVQNKRWSDISY